MKDKKKESGYLIAGTFILATIIVLILVVVWFFTNNHETIISEEFNQGAVSSLECSSTDDEDAFFSSEAAQRFEHIIKILFYDENLKETSYRFNATYNSDSMAEKNKVKLHADYNKYMSAVGLNSESLNPVFSMDKSKLMVSLYAEAKKLDSAVARLFFIDTDDYAKISDYSVDDFSKMYESKGFTCKKSN